ncbi:DNA cytosine methyltransferase [Sporosarcina sp. resist]|uniref:DNA cytosine methyltransferase n=1 Tax=Sporosarcina sp. resist TaxID=2762563 RepID=UPI00164CFBD0|nr:DNA cytosine methyltransferase [Sporosarcina sp. resist]QNK89070.1 DNA cytosine methyltransferase [Sporosarcina sp. resist]
MIKLLSLYGGIGADAKAAKRRGVKVKTIDYVEWAANRVKAYNAMNPFRYETQDVRTWDLKPDILVHGSPCQDNSAANQNDEEGRSELLLETIRIIKEMGEWRPKFVIWENAMDYGLPQTRERVFCISILGNEVFDFSKLKKRPLRPMSEFRQLESEIEDIEKYVVKIPSMLNSLEDLATAEEIESNKSKFRYVKTIVDVCNTITERPDRCPAAGVFKMEDGRYRYPTEREWWRLMDFDDDDFDLMLDVFPVKPNNRSATLYALAGNSIAVCVLEAIFEVILSGDYATSFTTDDAGQLQLIC